MSVRVHVFRFSCPPRSFSQLQIETLTSFCHAIARAGFELESVTATNISQDGIQTQRMFPPRQLANAIVDAIDTVSQCIFSPVRQNGMNRRRIISDTTSRPVDASRAAGMVFGRRLPVESYPNPNLILLDGFFELECCFQSHSRQINESYCNDCWQSLYSRQSFAGVGVVKQRTASPARQGYHLATVSHGSISNVSVVIDLRHSLDLLQSGLCGVVSGANHFRCVCS